MAAYAALVSLMNTIEQITNHPRFSTSLDNNQIQSVLEKAGLLLEIIEGNNYGGASKEAEDLERRITSAAHAAEDVIESHIVGQIHAEPERSSFLIEVHKKIKYLKKKLKNLKRRIGFAAHVAEDVIEFDRKSLSCSRHLHRIVEDMDAILEKANELKEEEKPQMREEEQPTHSRPDLLETGESAMVGFEEELNQIMAELTNERTNRHTISIVGMGGMGKTTLARNVYQNLLTRHHFDLRAWATVSQHNVSRILSQLLFGNGESSNRCVAELGQKLHKTLYGRRYLIILDDIWSIDVWDELNLFFPDNGNGSRVLLTTRLSNVANDSSSSSFAMKLLDKDKSWELFCEKAFKQENCPYPELEDVGKEIVKLCRGLPLSIVVIGGSLRKSPRTLGDWKNVARDITSTLDSEEKQKSLDILFSSYNHLPAHLKPCFLHLGFFKRHFSEISVSEIIKLWVAEGFLKSNDGRVLEEIAEDYLKDLTDRNLIFVSRRRKNGKMKCCEMHDLLRDLCSQVAAQQEFFHVSRGSIEGIERRIIMMSNSMTGTVRATTLARSIRAYEVDRHELNKHRLLRILGASSLESVEESFECVNLRYLALQWPSTMGDVWEIPTSVSLLWNLHTLILGIGWAFDRVVAPVELWEMRQLRHIKCPQIYLPHPSQHGLPVLENLQTLETLVNFRLSEKVCRIIPNIKKLHLVYCENLEGYNDSLSNCLWNLSRLHKLESIKTNGILSPNRKVLRFLSSVNKLSLSNSQLHWKRLSLIGSLPLLEVLNLESGSFTAGGHWNPIDGQFPRLKFLKISYCELRCWNAEARHFPVLENLVLSGLFHLEEIPWGIGEIPTLELIWIDQACNLSTIISAVRIKEGQLESQGNEDLQIRVTRYDSDLASFRDVVEKEGLAIDNIQLKIIQ